MNNDKYEIFEGDPNSFVVYNAWVNWRDEIIEAGRVSVSHPNPAYRAHAIDWFKSSPSVTDANPHVREGAHYFFRKGQTQ